MHPEGIGIETRFETETEPQIDAHIAQSVEHFLGKEEVTGSNPVMGSTFRVRRGVVRGVTGAGPDRHGG